MQIEILSLEKISEMMNDERIKAVTFGVSDCLVTYPFWRYSDLFWLLQKDFQAVSNQNLTHFYPLRISAEEYLKKKSRTGAVDIKQIYKYISETEHITSKEAETLMKQECRLAEMYCEKREFGYKLFQMAKEKGKKIFILSDNVVLRSTIHRILESCGYNGWDKIFVASHTKRTKKYGSGYRYFLSQTKYKKDEILHIGSDKLRDSIVPTNIGIKSVWVPSCKYLMTKTSLYSFVLQMLSIDGIQWINESLLPLRSVLAQAADYLYDEPNKDEMNKIDNASAIGALLAFSDKNDFLVKAALANNESKISLHHTNSLIDHFGSSSFEGTELPLEYLKKYADEDERAVFKNFMSEKDFKEWSDGIEENMIETKVISEDLDNSIFAQGTRKRAFLRFILGI